MFGGKWTDADGKSTLGTDPAWAKLLTWQKDLIDWYGYDNLVSFQAGARRRVLRRRTRSRRASWR